MIKPPQLLFVNPVRKFLTFQRDDSHGALNPVFAPKEDLISVPAASSEGF
jgi:hypothetical protein